MQENLSLLSLVQLRELAKERGVKRITSLRKSELIETLQNLAESEGTVLDTQRKDMPSRKTDPINQTNAEKTAEEIATQDMSGQFSKNEQQNKREQSDKSEPQNKSELQSKSEEQSKCEESADPADGSKNTGRSNENDAQEIDNNRRINKNRGRNLRTASNEENRTEGRQRINNRTIRMNRNNFSGDSGADNRGGFDYKNSNDKNAGSRPVNNRGNGNRYNNVRTQSDGRGQEEARTGGRNQNWNNYRSQEDNRNQNWNNNRSQEDSRTDNRIQNQGWSSNRMQEENRNQSWNNNRGQEEGRTDSRNQNWNNNRSQEEGRTDSRGQNQSWNNNRGQEDSRTDSRNQNWNNNRGQEEGRTDSRNQNWNNNRSQEEGRGQNQNWNNYRNQEDSRSQNQSWNNNRNQEDNRNQNWSNNRSQEDSRNDSQTWNSAETMDTDQNTAGAVPISEELGSLDSGNVAHGILEIITEGYGFIRSENYLTGDRDVYVSPSQIRRFNLKTGDMVMGAIRISQYNEKYPALLYITSVNGEKPENIAKRPNFESLTPVFPDSRLVLETPDCTNAMRIMNLFSPIGKGQRGMIVSPPKAGKTTLLKQVANAVKANHPEVHIIILLIDERPEEVTDIRESIAGKDNKNVEVIYSTFDELPEHHRRVSSMVLERAKRLVEHGEDVMILLDSITRLTRACNLTVTASGRTLSGGLDPAALHFPKKFFGAARNMRDGGSLTILATALVDTGSRMDDVVFEEFKGTGNMEVVLDRKLSERRIFPAIDILKSGTRRDDLLLREDEQEAMEIIRKSLNTMKGEEITERVLKVLQTTRNNTGMVDLIRKMKSVPNINNTAQ